MAETIAADRWLFLPIETKHRELLGKTLLACAAAERGWAAVIGHKAFIRGRQDILPRGVFVEKSISPGREHTTCIARAHGNKLSAWCEEGLVYLEREEYARRRLHKPAFDDMDFFFAWGDNHARDVAAKMGPGSELRIVPTGNPRMDLLRPELNGLYAQSAAKIRSEFGDFILFNTHFGRHNHFHGRETVIPAMKASGKIRTESDELFARESLAFQGRLMESTITAIRALSDAFPDHAIIIRPHPSERFATWEDIVKDMPNVHAVHRGSANEWVMAAAVTLHAGCTTGVEGYVMGRPVVAYVPFDDARFDPQLPMSLSFRCATADDLVDAVGKVLSGVPLLDSRDSDEMHKLARGFIANIDGPLAVDRILDSLETLDIPPGRLRLPAGGVAQRVREIAHSLLDRDKGSYGKQKFPGLSAEEMRQSVSNLARVSGRFSGVRVVPVARDVFCLTGAGDRR